MIYYFGTWFLAYFGPARLLQSFAVLIVLALYGGFSIVVFSLPKIYKFLPHDRGREFASGAAASKGKPTGAGIFFITIFVILCFLICPLSALQSFVLFLTWFMSLTGFLDDRSEKAWGEYLKAFLDFVICVSASILLAHFLKDENGTLYFWLPFFANPISIPAWLYVTIGTILLWASVNTTNCTDGVDGLSSTLVLCALITMGVVFYFILGHKGISFYLLVPHLERGAHWAVTTFALAGVLMGYLWHNAYPSHVLMGDAGSRALGFYIGVCVLVCGNPFLIFATSTIIFADGGMGLVKVALKRFFRISIFSNVRFPLHDHMRINHSWSATQVLLKFLILQLLITVAIMGVFFKVR